MKKEIYLSMNGFKQGEICREIDYYIPLVLSQKDFNKGSEKTLYISFKENKNLAEIKVGIEYGELLDITVVESNSMKFFYGDFDRSLYIEIEGFSPYLLLSESLVQDSKEEISFTTIAQAVSVEVFDGAIVLLLPEKKQARFLLHCNENLSVLTNENFSIIGFITWHLSLEEKNKLLDYASRRRLETGLHAKKNIKIEDSSFMKNTKTLIKKILNLKNVDYCKLLFYGLKKEIIASEFCVDFAMEYLSNKEKLQNLRLLELASLNRNEFDKVEPILFRAAKISKDNEEIINKLWFYLVLASDISELGFID